MASIIDPEKRELRGRVRERLAALSPEELVRSDEALFERFLALPQVAAARTIFAFWGIPGKEPDTAWLIGELVRRGKTVGLPRMLPEHRMEVRQYDPDKPLVKVSFGISEPGEDCPPLRREEIGLVLVPAVCYDRRGYRLGFGGGYYDRWPVPGGGPPGGGTHRGPRRQGGHSAYRWGEPVPLRRRKKREEAPPALFLV